MIESYFAKCELILDIEYAFKSWNTFDSVEPK